MMNVIGNYIGKQHGLTASAISSAYLATVEADGGVVEAVNCLTERIQNLKTLGLWDRASAVWLPHGYKESKLYAVKGGANADLAFTRAGTRTRKGPTYVEQVPYNLFGRSEDITSGSWFTVGTVTRTANAATAPNGTLTADRVQGVGVASLIQSVNIGIGPYTISCWAKAVSPGVKNKFRMFVDGGGLSMSSDLTATDEWQRFVFYGNSVNTASRSNCIVTSPVDSSDVDLYVWGAQLVSGTNELDYFSTSDRFNVPALDYTNDTCPALSVEPARTNLLLQSETFDNASWTKTNTTVSANVITSPDGLTTAEKLIEAASNTDHHANQTITKGASAIQYTLSVYAKSGERTRLMINADDVATNGARVCFDLSGGQLGFTNTYGTGFTVNSYSLTDVGNGWYRCVHTFTTNTATSLRLLLILDNASGTAAMSSPYLGNGTNGLYIWGAQLEAGSYATSYIPTTTASVSRIADDIGVLIPERTNMARYSNDFSQAAWVKTGVTVTSNTLTDPNGGLTGDEITAAASAATQHSISSTALSGATGTIYKWSAYLKYINYQYIQLPLGGIGADIPAYVNVDLLNGVITQQDSKNVATITAEANGWYRVSVQLNSTNTGTISIPVAFIDGPTAARSANSTTTGVEKFGLWGAQLEVGTSVTELIETSATALHDGSVIGQTEGTLYFNGDSFADGNTKAFGITDGTTSNRVLISFSSSNSLAGIITTGGVVHANVLIPFTTGVNYKVAVTYQTNKMAFFINGVKIGEDLTVTVPPTYQLQFTQGGVSSPFYGNMNGLTISPTALTDAQAIALTTP